MVTPPFMPIKLNKPTLILGLILFLALFVRGYRLSGYPSLNPDEAALGYNAYSLLQTGQDEHGISWPIHFRSFGDYKPGGYVYLALPFIKVFGLTPLAVRLPNLILSVITILFLYKLVLLLTKSNALSLYSSIVLSLSPWHIHFSRGAWESSASVFFILAGIYYLYCFIHQPRQKHLILSAIFFSLSFYLYHSARIITPLIIIFIVITNYRLLLANLSKIIFPLIIGLIITIPVLLSFLNSGGSSRFNSVGFLSDTGPKSRSEELLNQHPGVSLYTRITHNYRLLYGLSFLQKYTSHFDTNFLFISGDDVPRSKVPDMGQLYFLQLPFLILGIVFIIKSTLFNRHSKQLVLALLLISPVASSLTFQAPSALRSLMMVIPFSIIIASGIYYFYELFPKKVTLIFIIILHLVSFLYYLDAYFVHYQSRYPFAWNQGFSEIVPFVTENVSNFDHIYFTNQYDQPYILYLFFSKYPPIKLHPQIKLTSPDQFGFSTVNQIDNLYFHIPESIPPHSLIINASDFQKTGKSFKIEVK